MSLSKLGAAVSGTNDIGLIIRITKVGATGNLIGPSLKLWSTYFIVLCCINGPRAKTESYREGDILNNRLNQLFH